VRMVRGVVGLLGLSSRLKSKAEAVLVRSESGRQGELVAGRWRALIVGESGGGQVAVWVA
jgi:hypothetical protein